jgi:hypothetical protein
MRLEGLGKLKKSNNLIGNGTRDLPAFSIGPQPNTLPREAVSSLNIASDERMTVIIIS